MVERLHEELLREAKAFMEENRPWPSRRIEPAAGGGVHMPPRGAWSVYREKQTRECYSSSREETTVDRFDLPSDALLEGSSRATLAARVRGRFDASIAVKREVMDTHADMIVRMAWAGFRSCPGFSAILRKIQRAP